MIIQTGLRTDIPAFYSEWLMNRLDAGFVCVRNPYNPHSVTRYSLSPEVVDLIGFCTKNPAPLLPFLDRLSGYGQYWFVTITPYGRETEPNVPPKEDVIESFRTLSKSVGINCVGWRYDPIFVNRNYTVERHISEFENMAAELYGYTKVCVISFIDLYEKVIRNFPEIQEVTMKDKITLGKAFIEIGRRYGMTIKTCAEGDFLAQYGADCGGCMTLKTYETAVGARLNAPKPKPARRSCGCHLTVDIGAYSSCGHFCRYCYANYDTAAVRRNIKRHNPSSPLLIGELLPDDIIHEAKQESWIERQITLL